MNSKTHSILTGRQRDAPRGDAVRVYRTRQPDDPLDKLDRSSSDFSVRDLEEIQKDQGDSDLLSVHNVGM